MKVNSVRTKEKLRVFGALVYILSLALIVAFLITSIL